MSALPSFSASFPASFGGLQPLSKARGTRVYEGRRATTITYEYASSAGSGSGSGSAGDHTSTGNAGISSAVGGYTIGTDAGLVVKCNKVVITAGAWTAGLLEQLGVVVDAAVWEMSYGFWKAGQSDNVVTPFLPRLCSQPISDLSMRQPAAYAFC